MADTGNPLALAHEPVPWRMPDRLEGHLDPVTRVRLEATPYMAAIPAHLAGLDAMSFLDAPTVELAADAVADIRVFDTEAAALPVAMPAVLLRTESASSSQIERLTANARNLAVAALGEAAGQNAALVADNATAMTTALATPGPLSVPTILGIHRALLSRSEPDIAGRLRAGPVWIGAPDASPHGADFIPPRAERLNGALADLVTFAATSGMNPLIVAALTHAQFETIHPFEDGNGRTGRVIVHTLMRDAQLVRHTTVPVSAGLLGDVDGYFRALTAYRAGDPKPIVRAFAVAARRAVVNGRALAADTAAIHERWAGAITSRRGAGAWKLADALFAQPVVNYSWVQATLGSSPQGAFNAIDALVRAGILTQSTRDKRNQLWQAKEVLDAMDAFAKRAQRRAMG
ncbi:Fic family protein [Demequina globuliformis]|uniref:Fic family protein n=1 Tax=Demequina globuliformis TaxID=676202 RepID=UPI000AAE7DC4|nr:Fic family protein [Demequina globuliformis]